MRAWLEIDLEVVRQNYKAIRKTVGSQVGIIAVVKADAYGHGIEEICRVLDGCGVDMFAVISLEEAIKVRRHSRKSVLILNYLDSRETAEAINLGFVLTLYDKEMIPQIDRAAERVGRKARVHLKVETGLNRLGLSLEETVDFLVSQRHFPHVHAEAVFSHLARADNYETNARQLRQLQEVILRTQDRVEVLPFHLTSSYALKDFAEGYLDAVRVGLAFYGIDDVIPGLSPCLSFKSVVAQVKAVPKNEGVSYGFLWTAKKQTDVAIVCAGYAEGFTQALTGRAEVLINGNKVPVIGKIAMNMCIADVTGLPAKRGDEVVLIGSQKNEDGQAATIKVAELAQNSGLRHHEIVTRIGCAVPRKYLNE
jgi:alanine racemase